MSLENQIRDRILQNFKSVRSFALSAGLPYTTVDTMLKKGIQYSSVELVSRVATDWDLEPGGAGAGRDEGLSRAADRFYIGWRTGAYSPLSRIGQTWQTCSRRLACARIGTCGSHSSV